MNGEELIRQCFGFGPTRRALRADLPGERGGEAQSPIKQCPAFGPTRRALRADLPGERGGEALLTAPPSPAATPPHEWGGAYPGEALVIHPLYEPLVS